MSYHEVPFDKKSSLKRIVKLAKSFSKCMHTKVTRMYLSKSIVHSNVLSPFIRPPDKSANYPSTFLKKQGGYCNRLRRSVRPIIWDLLGIYAFFATFSNTVSTQEVSNCKSNSPSVMLSPP